MTQGASRKCNLFVFNRRGSAANAFKKLGKVRFVGKGIQQRDPQEMSLWQARLDDVKRPCLDDAFANRGVERVEIGCTIRGVSNPDISPPAYRRHSWEYFVIVLGELCTL